jgi:3-hydroxybutyrate dehydrogenase
MHKKLEGKVALVTGASSGLGHAIALKYAAQGVRVAICDLKKEQAETAAQEITRAGGDAIAIRMDVTSEDEVNAGADQVAKKWGKIDILVSNAGIQIVHPVEDFPFADWKKLLAVHLDGAFLTTKACVRHMYKQKSGALIYMGSAHSHEASPLKSAYVTAKHGILGLSRVMAKEGAKYNVRSNVICPGFVDTPLVRKQIPEQAKTFNISEQEVIEKIMLGTTVDKQFTTVDDVAEVALFLAGFETNALTGQSIVVSHGWSMR